MSGQPYYDQPDLHVHAPLRASHLIYPGNLKEALRQAQEDSKKTLFGVAHGIPSTYLTKVIASTKPDFIWIDVEHGTFNRQTLCDSIHAASYHSEGKSLVMVRVPKHDEISLTTALDAGAAGIVIPHCESAEEVTSMMKEIYYPPMGQRSFSPWVFTTGINDQSLYPNDHFNMTTANRHIAVIPQIESVKGLDNIDEIASVPGVTALMFGPGDYMADAGIPVRFGGPPPPELYAAMGRFSAAGRKHGLPMMGTAPHMHIVPNMIAQGYRAIVVVFDVWGTANLVNGRLVEARGYAENSDKVPAGGPPGGRPAGVPNGHGPPKGVTNGHGPPPGVANGQGPPPGVANGQGPPSVIPATAPNGAPLEQPKGVSVPA